MSFNGQSVSCQKNERARHFLIGVDTDQGFQNDHYETPSADFIQLFLSGKRLDKQTFLSNQ